MDLVFASDLHGSLKQYEKLFSLVKKTQPDALLLGGDLLPHYLEKYSMEEFISEVLFEKIKTIKETKPEMEILVILGNDDPRTYEQLFLEAEKQKLIQYIHKKTVKLHNFFVTGYSYVPPTPFQLKDWERYDVSRFVDVGAIAPESGIHTVEPPENILHHSIKEDLQDLVKNADPKKTIFLFHTPPYNTVLDRAALDGQYVNHAPLDVHIGSIAILRFIKKYQPFLTLHGHVHESTQLTGSWKQKIGNTICMNAAHDGPELSVISIDTKHPESAKRTIHQVG